MTAVAWPTPPSRGEAHHVAVLVRVPGEPPTFAYAHEACPACLDLARALGPDVVPRSAATMRRWQA